MPVQKNRPVTIRIEPSVPFFLGKQQQSTHEQGSDQEREGLVQPVIADGSARLTGCVVASLCVMVIALVALSIAVYIKVDAVVTDTAEATQPYLGQMVANLASILNSSASAAVDAAEIAKHSHALLAGAAPHISQMVNQSASLMTSIDSFSRHPTLSISGMG